MTNTSFRLVLGILIGATAASSARAQNGGSPTSYYETTASLLFLKPGSGNLEYGTLVSPLPLPSPNWANQSLKPDFTPAFNVGLRYFQADSNNDVQINWTHLSTDDSATFTAVGSQFVGPAYDIGPDATFLQLATGNVQYAFDSVNLDAGHFFEVGGLGSVRVFGGLQAARIRQNLAASFSSPDGTIIVANDSDSIFKGVGPRLGMKLQRNYGNLSFLGEIAGSALIGSSQSRLDFTTTSPIATALGYTPNRQAITGPDATQVVPSLDTKLGGGYDMPTRNFGRFRIEAGYQAAIFMNAVNQYSVSDVVLTPVQQSTGIFLRTAEHLQNDFTVHGLYLSGSWAF